LSDPNLPAAAPRWPRAVLGRVLGVRLDRGADRLASVSFEVFAPHFIRTRGSVAIGSGQEGQTVNDGADLIKDVGLNLRETTAFVANALGLFEKDANGRIILLAQWPFAGSPLHRWPFAHVAD
jgi:hypothetical protein